MANSTGRSHKIYIIFVRKLVMDKDSGTIDYMGYGSAINVEVKDGGNVLSSYQIRKYLEKVSNMHCKLNI